MMKWRLSSVVQALTVLACVFRPCRAADNTTISLSAPVPAPAEEESTSILRQAAGNVAGALGGPCVATVVGAQLKTSQDKDEGKDAPSGLDAKGSGGGQPDDLRFRTFKDPEMQALVDALAEKDRTIKELDAKKAEREKEDELKQKAEIAEEKKRQHKIKEEMLEKSLAKKAQAEQERKALQMQLMKTEGAVAEATSVAQAQSEEVVEENKEMLEANILNATEIKALPADALRMIAKTKDKKNKQKAPSALQKVEKLVAPSKQDSPVSNISSLEATMLEVASKRETAARKGEKLTGEIVTVVKTKNKKGHETQTKIIDADKNEFVLVKSKDSAPLTDSQLMADMVVVLLAATLFGLMARLAKLPVLLGYIMAGVAIGPAHLGYIQSFVQVETFAQFGVTFLLYVIGMEFSLAKILASWRVATIGGACAIMITILGTWSILSTIGTGFQESIFTGAFLSMSSTTVVLKCMEDAKQQETPAGQVMVVILIVQDIALGIMLGVMPVLDTDSSQIAFAFFRLLGVVAGVVLVAAVVTRFVLPIYFLVLKKTDSAELWVLGVVGLCLIASSSTEHLGLSIETGAFLAGIMINSGKHAQMAMHAVEPLRDIFAALFFTCIGVHVDLYYIQSNMQLIMSIVVGVTLTKLVVLGTMVKLAGYPRRTSFTVGLALAQIGEFAFVLAAHGKGLGLVSITLHKLLLHVTVVSLVLTPFLIKFSTSTLNSDPCSRGITASLDEVGINIEEMRPIVEAAGDFAGDDVERRKSAD